ncbi:MFS transporter [Novosphingobium sp. ZN18A2]|uniref:MFS transporter n=1 Tax=Novosphingobium sp. ZN18A2 TaxID=3079861 RepID=UPI0030D2C5CC
MLTAILPVRSLLLAIFMLMAGSGVLPTLIGLRLEKAGNGTLAIGAVATAYFLGLTVGAMRAGNWVKRVGHVRSFAAFVSVFSASTLAYGIYVSPVVWGALRAVDGFCAAGVFVCLESWLNERASPETRGGILAGYMICLYLGQAVGQYLLNLGGVWPALPFVVASILISLAAVPVLMTLIPAPEIAENTPFSLKRLYSASPLGLVGATVTGVMLGAFYGLAAVYARRLGMGLGQTSLFMSAVILGGVALQWPLGFLSDRLDRRSVIVAVLIGTAFCAFAVAFTTTGGAMLLGLGALFGGLSFALYPLCVAHTNDHLEPDERVGASGGLVLLYSAGAALGPMAGATAMSVLTASGLFFFIAACATGAAIFGLWRQITSPPVPVDEQQSYQILPRTTPVAATLDPYSPEEGMTE